MPYQERQVAEELDPESEIDPIGGAAGGPRNRPTSFIVIVILFALAAAGVAILFAMLDR